MPINCHRGVQMDGRARLLPRYRRGRSRSQFTTLGKRPEHEAFHICGIYHPHQKCRTRDSPVRFHIVTRSLQRGVLHSNGRLTGHLFDHFAHLITIWDGPNSGRLTCFVPCIYNESSTAILTQHRRTPLVGVYTHQPEHQSKPAKLPSGA